MNPPPPLNLRTPADRCMDRVRGHHASARILAEMRALGISRARLVRHARRWGITESRTRQVLDGADLTRLMLDEWIELVRTAWRD